MKTAIRLCLCSLALLSGCATTVPVRPDVRPVSSGELEQTYVEAMDLEANNWSFLFAVQSGLSNPAWDGWSSWGHGPGLWRARYGSSNPSGFTRDTGHQDFIRTEQAQGVGGVVLP